MDDFKISQPVQVSYIAIDPDGVTEERWRNALYRGNQNGHCVIYADGTIEVLNPETKIRLQKES